MFYNQSMDVGTALLIALVGFTVVFLVLMLIAVCVQLISSLVRAAEGSAAKRGATQAQPVEPAATLPITQSAGELVLIDVQEADAAVIMALVSEQSGIPLNQLRFQSIRRVNGDAD